MNFLHATVLSAIFVKCVIAINFTEIEFGDAMGRGDFATVRRLCKQDKSLCEKGTTYVIEKKSSNFIADFITKTNQVHSIALWSLRNTTAKIFEKVLKKVTFSQEHLVGAASSHALTCDPEKFVVLLNNIVTPKNQETAVETGILWFFYARRADCVDSLLKALKGKTFRSERLENVAIQAAFKLGARYEHESVLDSVIDHPAITPEIYADALIEVERMWEYGKRKLLLSRADRADLLALQDKGVYADLKLEFRIVIDKALEVAAPGGTRTHDVERSVRIVKQTFLEAIKSSSIKPTREIGDILGRYMGKDAEDTEDDMEPIENSLEAVNPAVTRITNSGSRAQAVKQTFYKITQTSTPQPTERIGDILCKYTGKDAEGANESMGEKQERMWNEFCEVIGRRDLETAVKLYEESWSFTDRGINCVIETNDANFIVDFMKQTKQVGDKYMLHALCEKGSEKTVVKVVKKIEFSRESLVYASRSSPSWKLFCSPEIVSSLLDQIKDPSDQESVVKDAIEQLSRRKRTDCIDAMLVALEGRGVSGKRLKSFAIQTLFRKRIDESDETLATSSSDHHLITAKSYAYGLAKIGRRRGVRDPIFKSLLEKADCNDLLEVRKTKDYFGDNIVFRGTIEDALKVVDPGKTRIRNSGSRAQAVKQTFRKVTKDSTPQSTGRIDDILSEYISKGRGGRRRGHGN